MRPSKRSVSRALLAVLLAALAVTVWPIGRAHAAPAIPSHALPVRYNPPQNAVLKAPPSQVQITFSEHVNPDISKLVVVDPSNRQVDNRDSQVSADGYTITISLPILPAGTYVVFWRTHSADDGHVAGGSYLFHVARADGTVPPLSGPLPSGTRVGEAGFGTSNGLDGPTLLATLARWVALLALTLLLGMIFWSVVVAARQRVPSPALIGEVRRGMRRLAAVACYVLLAASCLEIAVQLILIDGSAAGLVSLPLLQSVLLRSRFGFFVLLRMALALVALLALARADRGRLSPRERAVALGAFGLVLAGVFEYSGHGGSATTWWGPLIDYLHLMANGIWLGGLFTLAVVVIPALRTRDEPERAAYLAVGVPAFSIPALIAVAFVTITGPLNGAVRMTSLAQVWTTPFGRVLIIKSALFLLMVAISYHHAFRLRPRLAEATTPRGTAGARAASTDVDSPLARAAMRVLALARPAASPALPGLDETLALSATGQALQRNQDGSLADSPAHMAQRIQGWMQMEAAIGVGILLCAALLAPLAGTLAPVTSSTASFGAQGGAQTMTQQADALTVTLSVDPGKFGPNTFTVIVKNPDGTLASDGTVFLVSTMVEMDMGSNTIDLAPVAGKPGTYSGQGDLPMAGHWTLQTVIRTKEDPNTLHRTTFTVSASY
jgi:copper transport protein